MGSSNSSVLSSPASAAPEDKRAPLALQPVGMSPSPPCPTQPSSITATLTGHGTPVLSSHRQGLDCSMLCAGNSVVNMHQLACQACSTSQPAALAGAVEQGWLHEWLQGTAY